MDQQDKNFLPNKLETVRQEGKDGAPMKTVRFLIFRALLLITFITAYLYFLYGEEREHFVPIARNAAWNDLVHQIDPSLDNSAHETLGTQVLLIEKFLREHQSEVSVGIYDIKADKDFETIRNECLTRNTRQTVGGNECNRKQSSTAPNADSPLSRARTLSDLRFLAKASTSASIDDSMLAAVGKGY